LDGIARYRSGDIKSNLLSGTINGDRNVSNRVENNFLGFQSHWEIDFWGKLKNRRDAASFRILATEKGRQLVTTSLVAEVARLYYDLLGFDMELATIGKNIEYRRWHWISSRSRRWQGGQRNWLFSSSLPNFYPPKAFAIKNNKKY
jgi:outer membrane protein TolC